MNGVNETTAEDLRIPWHEVWMDVVTDPSRDTFRRILADPTADQARAYVWMAILGALIGGIQILFMQLILSKGPAYQELMGFSGITLICTLLGAPISMVVSLAFVAGIQHGVSSLLGGRGTFNDTAYCLGAIQAPVSVVMSLLGLIMLVFIAGSLPSIETIQAADLASMLLPQLIFGAVSLAIGIYAIVLQVMALSVVQNIGSGKAFLAVFSPVLLGIALGLCFGLAAPALALAGG
jgi:hypothetical protein